MHSGTRSRTDLGPRAYHKKRPGQKAGNEHCSRQFRAVVEDDRKARI